jgi:hypothetical protein
MDALTATRAPIRSSLRAAAITQLARWLALVSLVLLGLVGLVICLRRATGALVEPLRPETLLILGVVLAALAVLFRRALGEAFASPSAKWAVWLAPSVVLAVWAAGVTLSDTSGWGLAALVGSLLVEEGWSWGRWQLPRRRAQYSPKRERGSSLPVVAEMPAPPAVVRTLDVPDEESDESLTQRLVRRRDGSGEVIEGLVRVDFAAGQRHATAHVAICPPWDRVPRCDAEQADGPSARVKVAQVLTCGVRFELTLDEPADEPAGVLVEFSIQEPEG